MGLNPNWFISYDKKCKDFCFRFFRFCKKLLICVMFFAIFAIFAFLFFLHLCHNSFVEDIHVVGEKTAKNGPKTDI